MNEAQQLSNENADLHKSCDFVRAGFCDADNRRSSTPTSGRFIPTSSTWMSLRKVSPAASCTLPSQVTELLCMMWTVFRSGAEELRYPAGGARPGGGGAAPGEGDPVGGEVTWESTLVHVACYRAVRILPQGVLLRE